MTVCLIASVSGAPTTAEAGELERLLVSLTEQDMPVRLVLVVRGAAACPVPVPDGLHVTPVSVPAGTSLSASRNAALGSARSSPWWHDVECVAFPDDDCWYPRGSLARAASAVQQADVVCGRYGPAPHAIDEARFPPVVRPIDVSFVLRSVSSITMFWRRGALDAVGNFDERLGVGARYGSSEDVDVVLRALERGLRVVYRPQVVVCHDYRVAWPSSYYVGNCAVLAKHVRQARVQVLLLRRLLGGVALVVRRQLSLADLGEAWRAVRTVRQCALPPVVAAEDGGGAGFLATSSR